MVSHVSNQAHYNYMLLLDFISILINHFFPFLQVLFYTCIGQHLDIMTGQQKKDYNLFTREHYESIIINKSAYYTYKLPLMLGMILSNRFNEDIHKNVENISLLLGKLFQMQVSSIFPG